MSGRVRSAVICWPKLLSDELLIGCTKDDLLERPLDGLRSAKRGSVGEEDWQAMEYIRGALKAGDLEADDALPELCIAAIAWENAVWLQTVLSHCAFNPFNRLVEFDVLESAITVFGVEVVLPWYVQRLACEQKSVDVLAVLVLRKR